MLCSFTFTMKMGYNICLFFTFITLAYAESPLFLWSDTARDGNANPEMTVKYRGEEFQLLLKEYNPFPDMEPSCNYLGSVKNETGSSVAVTGCPGTENFEVSLYSNKIPHAIFEVNNGVTHHVDHPFNKVVNHGIRNTDIIMKSPHFNKLHNSANAQLPRTMKITIATHYDSEFKKAAGNDAKAREFITSTMTHVQALYQISSLGMKVSFEYKNKPTYVGGVRWIANGQSISDARSVVTDDKVNHYALFGSEGYSYGTVGIAYISSMCPLTRNNYRVSINEIQRTTSATAGIVAHEMGHAFGMAHDFDSKNEGRGCTGIMDYGDVENIWSQCSRDDLTTFYNQIVARHRKWCSPINV